MNYNLFLVLFAIVLIIDISYNVNLAFADPFCDFLSLFGICNSDTFTIETSSITLTDQDLTLNNTDKIIKELDTSNITDGSEINTISLNISTSKTGTCELYLKDENLKSIPISDPFSCYGSNNISLNELGKDAIESKTIDNDELSFFVKSNKVPIQSNISISQVVYTEPSYFAKIENGIVTTVLVADPEFISQQEGTWIQTTPDSSVRGNFAGVGYEYDVYDNVFLPPKPFDSWILNKTSWQYDPPLSYPKDGLIYIWNESLHNWELSK